ncbi:hypothetical protein IAD21_05030 [Abditibacteriota bacterium]|nr:hypothetical protein IAD21_05030 [Abditibacteriota bacterium]
MPPTQSLAPPSKSLPILWFCLLVLPLVIVAVAFATGHGTSPKRFVGALGLGCFAASFSFYLGFCARTAARQSLEKGGFGMRFGKVLGLFGLSLAFFALAIFLPADSDNSSLQGSKSSLFDGMDSGGCGALAGIFGPLVIGFLLHEATKSMI